MNAHESNFAAMLKRRSASEKNGEAVVASSR